MTLSLSHTSGALSRRGNDADDQGRDHMHRVIDARRWGRLLGAAVLGGALAAGALAALPAEAAVHSSSVVWVASGADLGDLSEDGSYSDSGSGGTDQTDGNSLGNSLNDT